MTQPTWPTAVHKQRLIESTREDRSDGYDFTQALGIEFENGVETVWTTRGRVFDRDWGSEQILETSVSNLPPHMLLAHVPKRVERKIIRGRRRGKGRYEVTIKNKFTMADGSVQSFTDVAVTDKDVKDLVDLPQDEVDDGLRGVLERGESLERFQTAKRLNNPRPDENDKE